MGNTNVKPHPRTRNKKQVHWKAAARPFPPGKPSLVTDNGFIPDVVQICWAKPVSDGGSPITGYLVEHKRAGSTHWVRASPLMSQALELAVSGLEPGWRYLFRVRAENAVGFSDASECSEPLTVTLQRSAIIAPKFTQEIQDTVALEDEKVEFSAHFLGQPPPNISWFKDGFEIFSSRRTRIITEVDKSVLTIHQSALPDEGEIKCTATNRAGHASTKAKLALEAAPSVRLPRQYEDGIIFEIGEAIRLKVTVAGRPTPLIFWSHDGDSIQNDDRHELEYSDKSSILKITDAKREDRGEYQIRAVNKLGQDFASFLVTITDKPTPPGKARVVMTLGRSVTLSWSTPIDDGGCKIGNYIIEYYRIGWDVWLKAATSRQLTTMLGDLIEGSEYKFRVKAESPYGVSEPSEETETVFIPDPRRGLFNSELGKGPDQPREIIATLSNNTTNRLNPKPKSPKTHYNSDVPVRPMRTKIKSPSKTPEASPRFNRKHISQTFNKMESDLRQITDMNFDRSSMMRELAYGIPEIKIKRSEIESQTEDKYEENANDRITNRTPSPRTDRKLPSPSSSLDQTKSVTPPFRGRSSSPAENTQNFTGSSEFMLVLYPEEREKGERDFSDLILSFDENAAPPPMSLSAPELGTEPPLMDYLKRSASSTELLNFRLMERMNTEALEEELKAEMKKNDNLSRKFSLDIPIIQINSKDSQDIVGLGRKSSFTRRMSAGVQWQQSAWAQRRQSLKNACEINDVLESKLRKFPESLESRRELMMLRQRSESEELEEEVFEKVRQKMALQKQTSAEKRSIDIVDEEKWQEDESEFSSEEESESSEDERKLDSEPPLPAYDEEEEETYHPRVMNLPTQERKQSDEPFEILTKRKEPPDPSLVPKPILKKKSTDLVKSKTLPIEPNKSRTIPIDNREIQRGRSHSIAIAQNPPTTPKVRSPKGRQRSLSLIPDQAIEILKDNLQNQVINKMGSLVIPNGSTKKKSIMELAKVTSIAGASVIISENLTNNKQAEEETKVVVDHYGDIVKSYSNKNKQNIDIQPEYHAHSEPSDEYDSEDKVQAEISNQKYEQYQNVPLSSKSPEKSTVSECSRFIRKSSPAPKELRVQERQSTSNNSSPLPNRQYNTRREQDNIPRTPSPSNNTSRPKQFTQTQQMSVGTTQRRYSGSKRAPSPVQSISGQLHMERASISTTRRSVRGEEESQNMYRRDPRYQYSEELQIQEARPYPSPTRTARIGSKSPSSQRLSSRSSTSSQEVNRLFQNKSPPSWEQPSQKRESPSRALYRRKTSPSPVTRNLPPRGRTSPSPATQERFSRRRTPSTQRSSSAMRKSQSPVMYRPKLREMTTQTSFRIQSSSLESLSMYTPEEILQRQEQLLAEAEVKVKGVFEYVTDLAMLAVACWLYLFKNEFLAIPVLLVLVYRQLWFEVNKLIPRWIKRRFRRKNNSRTK